MAKDKEKTSGGEMEFLKRAREEKNKRNPIKPVIGFEYVGEFVTLEVKKWDEGTGKKKKSRENSIISMADLDTGEIKRYWSFGLLNWFILEEYKVQAGDRVFFVKTEKNEKGFYGCDFYSESKGGK